MHGEAGKGGWYRPVDREKYGQHYDRIFRKGSKMEDESKPTGPGEFQKFPKIPRLYRDIIITEKIDGTNAQVYVPEDPDLPLWAGSRKRWITPESDNFGFAAWVRDHEDELRQLGPGHHYGEWWGVGIQRKYGLDHRRFSLFNVSRWKAIQGQDYWHPMHVVFGNDEPRQFVPLYCDVVPVLYSGIFSEEAIQNALAALREYGSTAAPDFKKPEGIVIFHRQSGHLFKVTLEGDEKSKGE